MDATTRLMFSDVAVCQSPIVTGVLSKENVFAVTSALFKCPTPETLDGLLATYLDYELQAGEDDGWTVLAIAIEEKALPLVRYILDKAPSLIHAAWHGGNTPYIIHATCDFVESVV